MSGLRVKTRTRVAYCFQTTATGSTAVGMSDFQARRTGSATNRTGAGLIEFRVFKSKISFFFFSPDRNRYRFAAI